MEIKIIWSDIAIAQLEDIFDFHKTIASHSIAQKLVKSIIKKSLILKSTPLLGVKNLCCLTELLNIDSSLKRITRSFIGLMIIW